MATGEADTGRAGRADDESALRPQDRQELEALRFGWGDAYLIGHDGEHAWHARRRDEIGALITADGPDALRREIAENYAMKPVPGSRAGGRTPRRRGASWGPTLASC